MLDLLKINRINKITDTHAEEISDYMILVNIVNTQDAKRALSPDEFRLYLDTFNRLSNQRDEYSTNSLQFQHRAFNLAYEFERVGIPYEKICGEAQNILFMYRYMKPKFESLIDGVVSDYLSALNMLLPEGCYPNVRFRAEACATELFQNVTHTIIQSYQTLREDYFTRGVYMFSHKKLVDRVAETYLTSDKENQMFGSYIQSMDDLHSAICKKKPPLSDYIRESIDGFEDYCGIYNPLSAALLTKSFNSLINLSKEDGVYPNGNNSATGRDASNAIAVAEPVPDSTLTIDSTAKLYEDICNMQKIMFRNTLLYPNGENDCDKSRQMGLFAYLLALWMPNIQSTSISELCSLYGHSFSDYGKSVDYINAMLSITNYTYQELRKSVQTVLLDTYSAQRIIENCAKCFVSVSSIGNTTENLDTLQSYIIYYINSYVTPTGDKPFVLGAGAQAQTPAISQKANETTPKPVSQVQISPRKPAAPPKICKRCGATISSDGVFCPKCGTKYESHSAVTSVLKPANTDLATQNSVDEKTVDQLRRLKQLYDEGILTEYEFQLKKKQILGL